MKKLFTALTLLIVGCLAMNAGTNPLRLKSGTLAPLKDCGGTIFVTMDFDKAKCNRKALSLYLSEDYDSSIQEFNSHKSEMMKWFCDRWNDDIERGPKTTTNADLANFRVNLIIKTIQLGAKNYNSYVLSGASVSGYAEFYRNGEEEPFAVVEILKMQGTQMGTPLPGYVGLNQIFNDMAEYLCDLIYHYK